MIFEGSLNTLGIWTCAELAAAIASASMPCMRPLMQKSFYHSFITKNSNSREERRDLNDTREMLNLNRTTSRTNGHDFQIPEDGSQFSELDDAERSNTCTGPDSITVTKTFAATIGPQKHEERLDAP